MKNTVKILAAAFAMTCVFAACDSRLEQPLTQANIVLAPEVYGTFDAPETRAHDLGDRYNDFNDPAIRNRLKKLPVGSTVWLTYRKAKVANPNPDIASHWEQPDLQAYVVKDAAGYNALYPIGADEYDDENGVTYLKVPDSYAVTNPLYLTDGQYQFRMVSPANPIRMDNLAMQVDNGMYVYANDERYNQTKSKVVTIQNNDQGVQNIVLNPMINQTARVQVRISKGNNVAKMEMLSMGVEVSGLQNPETENGKLAFKWSSLDIKDTLVMKRADKKSRAIIREFETEEDGSIVGSTGILPTNAMSTQSLILINLAVNGIPTQYVVCLSQIKFVHGHSYNLDVQVDADGNINVMNWANQAWTGEVTLN